MSQTIFSREYVAEELADIDRDVSEAFYSDTNPRMVDIPVDEHGFNKGRFTVTITWEEE